MYPPIFAKCSADAGVTALIGSAPCRLYMFGLAPQDVIKPYAVWQTIGGGPENFVNQRPDTDKFILQVDVYAASPDAARGVADAISHAVELDAHVTSWKGEFKEPETKDYRSSFEIDWIVHR